MYTHKEVADKVEELGGLIISINKKWEEKIKHHKERIHEYIANSDLTYSEAYSIMKKTYTNEVEFNKAMPRIKNTIWKRDNK